MLGQAGLAIRPTLMGSLPAGPHCPGRDAEATRRGMGRQSKAPSRLGRGEGPGDWSGFFVQELVLGVTLLFCHSGAPSLGAGGVSVSFPRKPGSPRERSPWPRLSSQTKVWPLRSEGAASGTHRSAHDQTQGCAVATSGPQTWAGGRRPPLLTPGGEGGLGGRRLCGAGRREG